MYWALVVSPGSVALIARPDTLTGALARPYPPCDRADYCIEPLESSSKMNTKGPIKPMRQTRHGCIPGKVKMTGSYLHVGALRNGRHGTIVGGPSDCDQPLRKDRRYHTTPYWTHNKNQRNSRILRPVVKAFHLEENDHCRQSSLHTILVKCVFLSKSRDSSTASWCRKSSLMLLQRSELPLTNPSGPSNVQRTSGHGVAQLATKLEVSKPRRYLNVCIADPYQLRNHIKTDMVLELLSKTLLNVRVTESRNPGRTSMRKECLWR